ncbi:MAG: type II toxin-antitoxin system RelE/ParE family toxin [Rhizonema sp. PD38]|nr:type II toxin-antitoxin system RelE/ParE family toxin [Rhizonema sp. PD38]
MSYQVTLTPVAVQQIQKLAPNIQLRLAMKLEELAINPRPVEAAKLMGVEELYKVRVNEYRLIYQVQDETLSLTVVKTVHPRDY